MGEIANIHNARSAGREAVADLAPKSHFLRVGLLTQRKTPLRQALAVLPNSEEVLASISDTFSNL
jgi:hypothetical protein